MAQARTRGRRTLSLVACAIVSGLAGCASPDPSKGDDCKAGAACMTNNPGACAGGHIVCTAGKASCAPDATEQPCYTGEPATRHTGACHDGTQSCIGTLGTCTGQVLPKPEDCFNNVDDDCDRDVNNGCPASLSVGQSDALVARGGAGGNPVTALCPSGAVVTGVQIQLSAVNTSPGYVISVQPSCAVPQLVRGAKDYSVTMMSVDSSMMMTGTDAARPGSAHITCAASGLAAAAGTRGSVLSKDRTVIESLGINCSTAALAFDGATNQLSVAFAHDAADSGAASVQVQGTPWDDSCGAGEVLIGFQGRTGAQMDQVQGVCAPLTVTYN
jgi:hypothetical protein